jgi:hypothetical protein
MTAPQVFNQLLNAIPVVKYSTELYTDSYLNNPIQFTVNPEFNPTTVLSFLNVIPNSIPRDISNYTPVDINNTAPQYKTISMFTFKLDKEKYNSVFANKKAFTQFGI